MYYPCSENKGADQLRGYREADLRLCFRLGKNPVFSRCGSMIHMYMHHLSSSAEQWFASVKQQNRFSQTRFLLFQSRIVQQVNGKEQLRYGKCNFGKTLDLK